ncbi:hypothetical protein FLA105534_01973 [Flavobacterium bizetiae]|uniref:Uncharacterized protein n=1 Tax=Flavobacterium bizetiae TaxID=2704140 RepID=A0A6J4GGZ2_9FLAO|nr:hypothetical protein [Flavobacterium bizetiae]CAA9198154.1 hypothetical protein FLA105534_01973 [Flavobacterium bizetiae]CAD5342339.1 hypothetical protein FLA105535_02324 [Flavobacterium bizetiae]CAD5348860.1 hypothetical protein FLA105534_02830 [Flavobacterium bizetiae]
MRKILLPLLVVIILLSGSYLFYNFKINKTKKEYYKNLSPKDLDPKSFIELFKERYNKTPINSISMVGDFPENWVKSNDVEYLMSIMNSREKCCGYMNVFSSFISNENAEVGGFAIIFLNSYISNTKINLGLNCNPKTDEESVKKIENWYRNMKDKN